MTLTEFKRFANENNIVPVPTEIYSQMISNSVKYSKMKKVLQEIRQEIDKWHHLTDKAFNDGIDTALEIIDKHIKEIEGSNTK